MERQDFLEFVSNLNGMETIEQKKLALFDNNGVRDFLAELMKDNKFEYDRATDLLRSAFEGTGKVGVILTLVKLWVEKAIEQEARRNINVFSDVDINELQQKNGQIIWNSSNIIEILRKAKTIKLVWDKFSNQTYFTEMPWEEKDKPYEIKIYNDEVIRLHKYANENNEFNLKVALNKKLFPCENRFPDLEFAVASVAKENPIDTPTMWLNSYAKIWDGKDRITDPQTCFLHNFFKCKREKWTSTWARMFMLSLITKIIDPTFETRTYFVIEGQQNIGKSKFLRKLVPQQWHAEAMLYRETDLVELYIHIAHKIIVEFPELGGKDRVTQNTWKRLVSDINYTYRPKYGRHTVELPKRSLYVVTTNEGDYLNDFSGETRCLPIQFGLKTNEWPDWDNFDALWPQILSQAIQMYMNGERPYLNREEIDEQNEETSKRVKITAEYEWVTAYLDANGEISDKIRVQNILDWLISQSGFALPSNLVTHQPRIWDALKRLGFKTKVINEKGKNSRYWVKEDNNLE